MDTWSGYLSRLANHYQFKSFRWAGILFISFTLGITVASCRSPFATPFPTPQCIQSTLMVGTTTFRIETISPAPDGSLTVPQDTPNIAYWVDGTDVNYVFRLSAVTGNISLLNSLQDGETAVITWADCNSTNYILSTPEAGIPENARLMDQSVSQVTIFVQPDPPATGFVVRGELAEEQIPTFNTPVSTHTLFGSGRDLVR
jgi:hypothetical protein